MYTYVYMYVALYVYIAAATPARKRLTRKTALFSAGGAGQPLQAAQSGRGICLLPSAVLQPTHILAHPRPHALACSQSPLSRASNLARVSCRLSALRCSAPAAPPLPPPPPPPPLSPAPGRRPNSSVIGRAAPIPRWLSACCETDNAVVVCKPSPTLNLFVPSLPW